MRSGLLLWMTAVLSVGISGAQSAPSSACTLEKQVYTCNWQAFESRLTAAHTVTIETDHLDRFARAELRKLANELGKAVVKPGEPADLTFLLIPVEPTGIHLGPSGEPLATLRIYAPGPDSTRGTLLWAETYKAQPDRPWPTVVEGLIEQFRARLPKR